MDEQPTKRSTGDIAHEVARGAVTAIPIVGGSLQVLFENIFARPIERRREQWLNELAAVVEDLQKRVEGFTPEALSNNEAFITVVMHASQVALRNHQDAKLQALRNAVLNATLPGSPLEDEQLLFIRLVDDLAPWHLRVLAVLDDPKIWMESNNLVHPGWGMGGVSTVLEFCIAELRGQGETYAQIVRDLQGEGLLVQGQFMNLTMTGDGMMASKTTARGKRFIQFISPP